MTVLVDTNVLLRWIEHHDSDHLIAIASVKLLRQRGLPMYVATQNLIEFWAVATRPRSVNGFNMPPEMVDEEISKILDFFPLTPELPTLFDEWRRLVVSCGVASRQVHDARLAALIWASGISHILTFNINDC